MPQADAALSAETIQLGQVIIPMRTNFTIAGNLKFINLGEVFQILGTNGSTGVLRILSKYSEKPGVIYFQNGNLIDAEAGEQTGLKAAYDWLGGMEGGLKFFSEPGEKTNGQNS